MRSAVLGIVMMLVALPCRTLSAQVQDQLQVGARVRLAPDGGKPQVGRVISVTADSIGFAKDDGRSGVRVLGLGLGSMGRLQVSKGKSRAKGALMKGLIGLGIGGVTGAALGAATYEDDYGCRSGESCFISCFIICSRGDAAGAVGLFGATVGVVIGGVIGAVTGWETWADVIPRRGSVQNTGPAETRIAP